MEKRGKVGVERDASQPALAVVLLCRQYVYKTTQISAKVVENFQVFYLEVVQCNMFFEVQS